MGQSLDLTGRRFGNLVALRPLELRARGGQVFWRCLCDCGKERDVISTALVSGHTKSCGCITRLRRPPRQLLGRRFGSLVVTVVDKARDARGKVRCECLCDCGVTKIIHAQALRAGDTRSCGCTAGESRLRDFFCLECGLVFRRACWAPMCAECGEISRALKHRKIKCGVTEYKTRLAAAEGKCQACSTAVEVLQFDHDHETGLPRGILCRPCNVAEGFFKADYSRLLKLYSYCLNGGPLPHNDNHTPAPTHKQWIERYVS